MEHNTLLLIALACIGGGLGLFVYTIISSQHKDGKEDETSHRYHRIINNAHNEARAILDTTSVASMGILADSKATNEHLSEQLDKVLQQIAAQHIAHLKQSSDEFSKSYDEKLNALQEQLRSHTEQSIHESEQRLQETLEKLMQPIATSASSSQHQIDERTKELIAQTEKELADYKAARMTRINIDIQDLVKRTYREVLRKSIPDSVHEELVIESLERAKVEGGLTI